MVAGACGVVVVEPSAGAAGAGAAGAVVLADGGVVAGASGAGATLVVVWLGTGAVPLLK